MNNKCEQITMTIVWVLIGVLIGVMLCGFILGYSSNTVPITRANEYLDAIPMSFPELVEQLNYEFTYEDAIYGASHCGADWNIEAGRCAEEYMARNRDVTRAELFVEVLDKGFTLDQAEFACDYVGVK